MAFDNKEYARQLRENAVRDNYNRIICSPELWEQIASIIESIPTADVVEVKHGYWEDLYKGKYDNPLYTCSECYCRALYKPETDALGNRVFKQELSKICPHCFAKMDGQRK